MGVVQTVVDDLTDQRFRVALYLGLASVPFTIALALLLRSTGVGPAGAGIAGFPFVLSCVVAGYRYGLEAISGRRAGIVAGIAGSLGAILLYLANAVTAARGGPATLWAALAVTVPIAAAVSVAGGALVGLLAGLLGDSAATLRTRLLADEAGE